MQDFNLIGIWENEFGSQMNVHWLDNETGIFRATYSSTTGATGVYNVVGIVDKSPSETINSQTISFSVSWRSILDSEEKHKPSSVSKEQNNEEANPDNWVSAFAGQIQEIGGEYKISTTYLLQKNTNPEDSWSSTVIAPSVFSKKASEILTDLQQIDISNTDKVVCFPLFRGKIADNGATPWYANIGIGSSSNLFKFMLDTGTDNTWITSTKCNTEACLVHQRFDVKKSNTYEIIDAETITKDFGPWGTMQVNIGKDDLYLENEEKALERMKFQTTVHYEGFQFQNLVHDGGFGIVSPYWKPKKNTDDLMLSLWNNQKIKQPIVSYWTDNSTKKGECVFGAIDKSKFDETTLNWINLQDISSSPLNFLWSIELNNFLVEDLPVEADITHFELDTGSSCFKGCANLINKLISAVTQNGTLPIRIKDKKELEKYPTISLILEGKKYKLTPEQYFFSYDDYLGLGIEVLDGMPEGMLLVGSAFLDTVYSIYDYSNKRIGIAELV